MDRGSPCVLVFSGAGADGLSALLEARGLLPVAAKDWQAVQVELETALAAAAFFPVDTADTLRELRALRHRFPEVPVVAFGPDSTELMRAALAEGALEYLAMPAQAVTLQHVLDVALASSRSVEIESAVIASSSGLLGSSRAMASVRDTIARVAAGSATVLVRGETGTGKELVARAIHEQSARRSAPFIKVHAAALPDALLESELFGYEKGAFTGANQRKPGRVELAEHGTLFLDEIAEVSPVMQAKLLRLIQDREYECLGGTRTLRADIRFLAATHRDLEDMVRSGAFREDLFYRLNVVTAWLPPLRARRADITPIVLHYLRVFREQNGKPRLVATPEALHALEQQRWPGNVRQLVNFVERLVVLARADLVGAEDVQRELSEQLAFMTQAAPSDGKPALPAAPKTAAGSAPSPAPASAPVAPAEVPNEFASAVRPLREDLRRTELRAITKALHSAKGNRALAARLLGVSRRTLYTKLEEHGIE